MGAALELAARQRRSPNVVIVLTDGETPWPNQCPDGLLDASIVVAVIREQAGFDMGTVPRWCVGVEINRS
jgi:predicted metal-dependent peptidase